MRQLQDNSKRQGDWSVAPGTTVDTVNGTERSAQEFRDALLLRYACCPPDLPIQCDGCQLKFNVCHALECKRGSLVVSRHNEIRDELSDLASKAFFPSAVRDEPIIHTSCALRSQYQAPRSKRAEPSSSSFKTITRIGLSLT
jgi:hypothetical protein